MKTVEKGYNMTDKLRIAAYTRISVDLELDKDNTSIENQKTIIRNYCQLHFPTSTVDYYEDRDHSGYTFEQRPGYMKLRPLLMGGKYDVLIVKDLSRFSRRNGKGLVEFEEMAERNVRIIAIGDSIDYDWEHTEDWMKIKLYFFVNEMPVIDSSKKVLDVIANRQSTGDWICAVPFGYRLTNSKKTTFEVDEAAAEVVREIFRLYVSGWGYKKIANHLTDNHIPTPRMCERSRKELQGDEYKRKVREQWSIVTVSGILSNDFYVGTLRQRKYRRKKINGADIALDESEHIVFEDHHEAIVDYRLFAMAQEQLKQRTQSHYRGIKKYDNIYSGILFCGDCGSPMFAMSRKDLAAAYTCGTYHIRGKAGCTSHHIRVDFLDMIIKQYVKKVKENSSSMLKMLEESLSCQKKTVEGGRQAEEELQKQIEFGREELKTLMLQKARDISRASGNSRVLEETYDSLLEEVSQRIAGLENQLLLVADTTNMIVRTNRASKTVLEIFDDILNKEKLDKCDLQYIVDRILVYEDHIEVKLKSDIDALLKTGLLVNQESEKTPANFKSDTENIESATTSCDMVAVQSARNQADKVFCVNVISNGSPSRIRIVRRISLGITTRPRSSMRRTIPVAFIYTNSPCCAVLPVIRSMLVFPSAGNLFIFFKSCQPMNSLFFVLLYDDTESSPKPPQL